MGIEGIMNEEKKPLVENVNNNIDENLRNLDNQGISINQQGIDNTNIKKNEKDSQFDVGQSAVFKTEQNQENISNIIQMQQGQGVNALRQSIGSIQPGINVEAQIGQQGQEEINQNQENINVNSNTKKPRITLKKRKTQLPPIQDIQDK